MKKLFKNIEVGDYKFKIGINRDIAIKCMEKFPQFFNKLFENSNAFGNEDTEKLIKSGGFVKALELTDYINENCGEVIKFALPLMLDFADDDLDSNVLIEYIYDNDADEVFNAKALEFLLMGFTPEEAKKPKVTIKF